MVIKGATSRKLEVAIHGDFLKNAVLTLMGIPRILALLVLCHRQVQAWQFVPHFKKVLG